MNTSHLKTFLKVASNESFTRAAQDLFVTQPTVTHHIQSLEEELGYQLFVRSSSSIRLTAEGKKLVRKADALFRLIDDIKGSTAGREKGLGGTLNIAASSVMGSYFMPPVLKAVLEEYPNIDIRLHFGTAYSIATWVQNAFVDVGFAPRSPGFAKLKFTSLLVEPCVLATSAQRYTAFGTELEKGNCADQPFILREKGTKAHDVAMRWLKKQAWYAGMRTPVILYNMESIKNLVLEDAGMTILPRCCLMPELENGLMREVATGGRLEDINYFMIERRNEKGSEVVSAFKLLLRASRSGK